MKPIVLIILDGWGIAPPGPGNAISQSKIPFIKDLFSSYPHGILEASGEAVGLPRGEDGNTETGHLNIGAGHIVYQDLPRINLAIADGSFFRNAAFLSAVNHIRKYESNLHLLGLIGSGGVHSNVEHLLALLQLAKEQDVYRVFLHLITDGRDSPPESASIYVKQIQDYLKNLGFGQIATIMGRYYAMDRDNRWDRTQKAYLALTKGIGIKAEDPIKAINDSYSNNITDEFIQPTIIVRNNKPIALIKENDSVIFFNFRIDRPRQLTKAFVLEDFEKKANSIDFDPYAIKYYKKHHPQTPIVQPAFKRGPLIPHLYFVTMTEYSQDVHASAVAFPPQIIPHPLGEVISQNNLKQLRIAETEKERFVTYYFNGQREAPFKGEDRFIVPSPKVPTYDLKPEMAAYEITDVLLKKIPSGNYDFIVVNFANADMVGHTGVMEATIKACETLDNCLAKIVPLVNKVGGITLITADHGNAEELINPKTGGVDTEHSTYPVPFIAVSPKLKSTSINLPDGILADIAPTILALMKLEKPTTMTGRNLLENIVD